MMRNCYSSAIVCVSVLRIELGSSFTSRRDKTNKVRIQGIFMHRRILGNVARSQSRKGFLKYRLILFLHYFGNILAVWLDKVGTVKSKKCRICSKYRLGAVDVEDYFSLKCGKKSGCKLRHKIGRTR